jgi:UDP-2,3-diacylglucosamine hydrolase
MTGKLTYFVSDVHLGLDVNDPAAREARFVSFLESLPQETAALYMLGDVWDFWYEYRDVVPKGYVRVFAALQSLMDRGVEVYFFAGNHDVWTYSYFESMGMKKLVQPSLVEIDGVRFCLGHGDSLGPAPFGSKVVHAVFHNRVLQFLFSFLHPWVAFRIATGWSRSSRLSHDTEYVFRGADEPLYKFAENYAASCHVDHFIFGHYHQEVHMDMPSGAVLHVLDDWMDGVSYFCFDGKNLISSSEDRI